MEKAVSKSYSLGSSAIRNLGKRILEANCQLYKIEKNDIEHLEEYRKDFLIPLTNIYNLVNKEAHQVHKGNVSSFRIKKIETIVSKLKRMEKSKNDRTGLKQIYDIAGCRFIVDSVKQLYELKSNLEKELNSLSHLSFKVKDKTISLDKGGYKAIHFVISCNNFKPSRKVEVQLRTKEQHSWATLVEIVDVVFRTKIKEGDYSDYDLFRFLKLYSERKDLDISSAETLIELERRKGVYLKLLKVFKDNILRVRDIWFFQADTKSSFFLFEIQNKEVKSISTFSNIENAEKQYFDKFNESEKTDLMLAKLNAKKFSEFCLAYSNYILVDHRFIEDWIEFCKQLIEKKNKIGLNSKEEVDYLKNLLEIENFDYIKEKDSIKNYIDNASVKDIFKIGDWIASSKAKEKRINNIRDKIESDFREPPKTLFRKFVYWLNT